MGLILILAGLLIWLLAGYVIVGIVLIVIGIVLFVYPGAPYGYSTWRGRRAPP